MFTGCSDFLCLQPITKEKLKYTSEFWVISIFSNASLTACWLPIFMSATLNQTVL